MRKKLRRGQVLAFFAGLSPCLIGLEACASAHYWVRELRALWHAVRLIPPHYVHPFVKTNKNDATDAEAICEALMRPTMRFAAVKSAEQQSVLMLHRARDLLVRQRTMLINALNSPLKKASLTGFSRHGEAYRGEGGFAILRDDEDDLNDQDGSSGRNKHEQGANSARHGLLRGAGTDELAHQQR